MKAMTTKLKPCPFCGGKIKKIIGTIGNTVVFVCNKYGADVCFYGGEYEPKATEKWNKRINEDEK